VPKKLVIGNWKMNGSEKLLRDFVPILQSQNFILALPYQLIPILKSLNANSKISAQDCSFFKDNGSYTGEISARMLKDCGAEYVIVGHSERRKFFNETSDIINKKIQNALEADLITIFCVNENFREQIKNELKGISNKEGLIIAYEPVTAIGTGVIPDLLEISSKIAQIKEIGNFKVLYGGSVNSNNVSQLLKIERIDGILVGGASLFIKEIENIIEIAKCM
jgi:triosephosphate isomerase